MSSPIVIASRTLPRSWIKLAETWTEALESKEEKTDQWMVETKLGHTYLSETTTKEEERIPEHLLQEVINYLSLRKGQPHPRIHSPLTSADFQMCLRESGDHQALETFEFLNSLWNKSRALFYDIITTAYFLKVKDLLLLCCGFVAAQIKGQSVEKIGEILKVEAGAKRATVLSSRMPPNWHGMTFGEWIGEKCDVSK